MWVLLRPPRFRGAQHANGEPEAAKIYERKLVLVRPYGHVAWRGDRAPTLVRIDRVRRA
ncbi:MAG: hypothetical protein QOF09_3198 [Alphaproteobacteria bacterium]|jgi:hypothetical protein|nr:hypothetical protein [Alphaproteobacteria bacterium]